MPMTVSATVQEEMRRVGAPCRLGTASVLNGATDTAVADSAISLVITWNGTMDLRRGTRLSRNSEPAPTVGTTVSDCCQAAYFSTRSPTSSRSTRSPACTRPASQAATRLAELGVGDRLTTDRDRDPVRSPVRGRGRQRGNRLFAQARGGKAQVRDAGQVRPPARQAPVLITAVRPVTRCLVWLLGL
jgi:hypothetical protein